MVMQYKVIVNGKPILVTRSYKSAAKAYDDAIYHADNHIIISLECRENSGHPWETARKDWL